MAQADKSQAYKAVQAAGIQLTKHYRDYTTDELTAMLNTPTQAPVPTQPVTPVDFRPPGPPVFDGAPEPELKVISEEVRALPADAVKQVQQAAPARIAAQQAAGTIPPEWANLPLEDTPSVIAGLSDGSHNSGIPIRRDSQGRIWFIDEVPKSLIAKPRARRRTTYQNPNIEQKVITYADMSTETVEIAGSTSRASEVMTTLPSYQVGVYLNPNLPQFKVHVYNDLEGFDFFDVVNYWGGEAMVPSRCKRIYVETDLCFEPRSVIAAIEDAYRELQLTQAGHAPSMVRR